MAEHEVLVSVGGTRGESLFSLASLVLFQGADSPPVERDHPISLCSLWKEDGTDDPRNGLVLCSNHHRALDRHLLAIKPDTLDVVASPEVRDVSEVGVEVDWIQHLLAVPHADALQWLWDHREWD